MKPAPATVAIVIYDGIEITYNESTSLWEFVLRGRTRTAQTLTKAKEFINNQPAEKREKMEPIKAFMIASDWTETKQVFGVITSFAARTYRGLEAWFSTPNGGRHKEAVNRLYLDTPENNGRYQNYLALKKQEGDAREAANKTLETMAHPVEPKE